MKWHKSKSARIFVVSAFVATYLGTLFKNLNESNYRSLQLNDEVTEADRVLILVSVTGVNPVARQLTAQLDFRFVGNIAVDDVTPNVDMKLFVNNLAGQQTFDFQKRNRMHGIAVTFPINGEVTRYPLDRYTSALMFLMTKAGKPIQPEASQLPQDIPQENDQAQDLVIGKS